MVDNSQEYRLKYWATRSSFARLLIPLTPSLAPDCSLHSRPPLRSLIRSLNHFAHSLARGTVNDWMAILSVFFSIFDHSAKLKNVKLLEVKIFFYKSDFWSCSQEGKITNLHLSNLLKVGFQSNFSQIGTIFAKIIPFDRILAGKLVGLVCVFQFPKNLSLKSEWI